MRHCIWSFALLTGTALADPISTNQRGLTGTWYDPSDSGQGFMIEVFQDDAIGGGGIAFGGWFTYDMAGSGAQRWYSFQGTAGNTNAALTIYQVADGYFDALPAPTVTSVGTATLQFSDCRHGQFDYAFGTDGPHGTISLERLAGEYYQSCKDGNDIGFGLEASPASDIWLSGAWYDPAVSGQGFTFSFDGSVTFGGWYTFTPPSARVGTPNQIWYSLQLLQPPELTSDSHYVLNDIPIYATSGGAFATVSSIQTTQVGTANLEATSCTAMTLTYNLTAGPNAGASRTINLQRPGPAPEYCDLASSSR